MFDKRETTYCVLICSQTLDDSKQQLFTALQTVDVYSFADSTNQTLLSQPPKKNPSMCTQAQTLSVLWYSGFSLM